MFFYSQNRVLATVFLTLAVISTFFLKTFENYQIYILPVIVLSILPFFNRSEIKILCACVFFWLCIEIFEFPIRFFNLDYNNFVISQLKDDKNGLALRSFSNKLKKTNSNFVHLNQLMNYDIRSWLENRPKTSFAITGDVNSFNLIFQTKTKFNEYIKNNFNEVKVESDFIIIDSKYALALTPEEIQIIREPEELTANLISLMSTAVATESTEDFNEEIEKRIDAAAKARSLYGYWKTGTARSWAYFTEGNLELLKYLKEKDNNLCISAKKKYNKASSLLISRGKTSILGAYVYSNAAVAYIICDKDFERAKSLLSKAQKLSTEPRSKKLVQINFEQVRNF